MHYQFRTICRGDGNLFDTLKKAGVNPFEYISFYALRAEGHVDGNPVTEQVVCFVYAC